MNKKFLIYLMIIIFILILIIFLINNYKNNKLGNNTIKSADKVIQNILNIESYNAKVTITITSNKTTNTYEAIQKYNKEKNIYSQEIISPESMKGIIFTYDGKTLKIENTRLKLNTIYKNYSYLENNELSINSFIEDYNNNEHEQYNEDDVIILETKVKNNNKYRNTKRLYIDKKTAMPIKLEIKDVSENTLVYILYNEIELNK